MTDKHTPMEHTKEYARDAAANWACGCKLALKKLCDCDNPAELDYTQCPVHAAAPELLKALEGVTNYYGTPPLHNPADDEADSPWAVARTAIKAAK